MIKKIIQQKVQYKDRILICWKDCKSKIQTLNSLVDISKGRYIALIDTDDVWCDSNKLQSQLSFLDNNENINVVGTHARYLKNNVILQDNINIKMGNIFFSDLINCNHIINSSVVMRKECAFWESEFLDDYTLWLKIASEYRQVPKFFNLSTYSVLHRLHDKSFFNGTLEQSQAINLLLEKYK